MATQSTLAIPPTPERVPPSTSQRIDCPERGLRCPSTQPDLRVLWRLPVRRWIRHCSCSLPPTDSGFCDTPDKTTRRAQCHKAPPNPQCLVGRKTTANEQRTTMLYNTLQTTPGKSKLTEVDGSPAAGNRKKTGGGVHQPPVYRIYLIQPFSL
jgi:hypothetical protein